MRFEDANSPASDISRNFLRGMGMALSWEMSRIERDWRGDSDISHASGMAYPTWPLVRRGELLMCVLVQESGEFVAVFGKDADELDAIAELRVARHNSGQNQECIGEL